MKYAFALSLLVFGAVALDLNKFLTIVDQVIPRRINIAVIAADKVIGLAETKAGELMGVETTRDDLADGLCGDVMVLFARGTVEPGNVGSMVGPQFRDALKGTLAGRDVSFTGVNGTYYPASIADYFSGGPDEGAQELARLVTKTKTSCPDTAIVMSGYSQGAQVVHKAAIVLGSVMASLSSVVTFGDPNYSSGKAVHGIDPSRVLQICDDGDSVCEFKDYLLPIHFTYMRNATQAAHFVLKKL